MLIKYTCECGSKRFFSSVQNDKVFCKNCGKEMQTLRDNLGSEILTTEESRYLGDEAIFNTIGKRVSNKKDIHHSTLN